MQATLILDSKVVKTKVFADNHDVDDLIKKCKAMVRRYDGYPFIQIKNTTYYDDKIVYDLHTFNHQSSVLEIDFNYLLGLQSKRWAASLFYLQDTLSKIAQGKGI